jgi:putative DNA primase/helicase
MNHVNYDDVRAQLQAAGFDLDRVEVCTRKRVKIPGNSQKGWYSTYEITLDGGDTALVGSYGWWVGGETFVHKFDLRVDKKKIALSAEQREAVRARAEAARRQADAERAREIEAAAQKATRWWRQLADAGSSGYLERKGFAPGNLYGARVSKQGNLVVPMQDTDGKIYGLQVIYAVPLVEGKKKRDKNFTPPGLGKKGHFFQMGVARRGGVVLVAEGFATGASLREATGLPVVIAFDAGNLLPVTQQIHKAHRRDIRVLVCGDDDYLTDGNPGKKAAETAAIAVNGAWTVPVFPEERSATRKGPTDFNDLHVHPGGGLQAVARQVQEALATAGWREKNTVAGVGAALGGEGNTDMPSVVSIAEACERYSMIYGAGGTWFDAVEHMLVPKADLVDMLPEHGMRDMRAIKKVVRLNQVGFDPAGTDERIKCNLWGGWPTVPAAGTCEVLLELLHYLCSMEDNARDVYQWVLKWLAYPIQHPGAKMRTALVLHGPQGAGKNFFFETVMAIYGDYGRVVDQSAIEDKFNDWVSRKLFLIADEVVARAELFHTKNKLKGLITGEWIRVNPKNIAAHDERNHVNIVFLSNERQPLVLEKDDRRYTVIWTPDKLPKGFYADVRAELAAGGRAALHYYLANLVLGDFSEHSEAPMTRSKADVIDISLDSVDRFLRDWQAGEISFAHGMVNADYTLPFCPCGSGDLYAAYLRYCKREGVSRPRESNQFSGYITKMPGWKKGLRDRREDRNGGRSVRQRFVIPSEEALTKAAEDGRADYCQQPAQSDIDYLTKCFFDFQQAGKSEL